MSREMLIDILLPYVQDERDRVSISLVSRSCKDMEAWSRIHVTISLCYSINPERLVARFPNIRSLKLKGQPRPAMYRLIPGDWGGHAEPWVEILPKLGSLKALHFRRMLVTNSDLTKIADVKSRLKYLKLEMCSGFTTAGICNITQNCTNLTTLSLKESNIHESDSPWFHELSSRNTALKTFSIEACQLNIEVSDFEHLGIRCPRLASVNVGDMDVGELQNFFRRSNALREFGGVRLSGDYDDELQIPTLPRLNSLSVQELRGDLSMSIVSAVAQTLRSLDLVQSSLSSQDHSRILCECRNLEVLKTSCAIGDEGLEVVGKYCTRLKRIRIEREKGFLETGAVTHDGLTQLANGCQDIEYLSVNVTNITNDALAVIGNNLKKLHDFCFVLLDNRKNVDDLPLDNGVRDLLKGCKNMRRLALFLRPGALTDAGLGYVGQYSGNVTWMLFGFVGQSDDGLRELMKGCQSLQKLEMKGTCFTEEALARFAGHFELLKYFWVHDYTSSQNQHFQDLVDRRQGWNIEFIKKTAASSHNNSGQVFMYRSLDGRRTDCPADKVTTLAPRQT